MHGIKIYLYALIFITIFATKTLIVVAGWGGLNSHSLSVDPAVRPVKTDLNWYRDKISV